MSQATDIAALKAWRTARADAKDKAVDAAIAALDARLKKLEAPAPPPPPPPPPPTGKVVQFPGTGPRTAAAFLALTLDLTIDVIEWAAGTYPWACFLNVARPSTRPLLVRPVGEVIWDGGGGASPAWQIGWTGGAIDPAPVPLASYITFAPGFTLQNYRLGLSGVVMARNADHIAMNGVKVRNCTGTGTPQTTHVVYLDSDGVHRGRFWQSNDWDIIGPANRVLNGLHIYHGPSWDHVEAKGWKVQNVHRWAYLYSGATDVLLDGWTGQDCDGTIDTDGTAQGVVSNCHATNAGPLAPGQAYWKAGPLADGGGNTAA